VAGRIRSSEKSSDLMGNQTCNLPVCSIVPQPIILPCAPHYQCSHIYFQPHTVIFFVLIFHNPVSKYISSFTVIIFISSMLINLLVMSYIDP
jgi:hypothetical protein